MSSEKHSAPVILYSYDTSPFAQKIGYILTLKNIPHQRVTVSPVLPRPDISELLGIAYRRIPLLAIGNDVYCDTGLISYALERRFPASAGFGTIFPRRKNGKSDTGMIKAFAKNYPETILFQLAVGLLPWQKFPESFLKDRSDFSGASINAQAIIARQPQMMSSLSSHLALLEEQLSDDREWLFDTELPSLADISVYFIYAWISRNKALDSHKFPKSIQWLSRLSDYLKQKSGNGNSIATNVSGKEAAEIIGASAHEHDFAGFDQFEAQRLGVQAGQAVSITPDDSGRNHPTTGKLVELNHEEFVLETKGSLGSVIRCHLPRLGYSIKGDPKLQNKL